MTIDIGKIKRVLAFVDLFRFHSCTTEGYIELRKNCGIIVRSVPFMICYIDSTIVGCRKNEKVLFSNVDEVSYNRNANSIKSGRFNLSKQAMFYGSLPTIDNNGEIINYGNQCPMFEVCKELQNHQSLTFPSFFTLSNWRTIGEICVVSLCFDEIHLNENPGMRKGNAKFEKSIRNKYSESEFECIREVWTYFSELTSKWDETNCHHYSILTAFFSALTQFYQEEFQKKVNGVIYPSAMTQAKGLNVAINPQTVDEQMKLTHVQMYMLRSRGLPQGFESVTNIVAVEGTSFSFDESFEKEYNRFNSFYFD